MERGQNDIKYWPGNLVIIIPTLFLLFVEVFSIYQKKTNNLEQACVSMGRLSQFLRLLCQVPREECKWRLDARNNPKWTKSPIPSEPRAPRSGWHPNSLLGLATGGLWNPGPWVVKWWSSQDREGKKGGGSMPERLFSKQTYISNSKNTQRYTFASIVYYFPTLLPIRGSKQGGNSPRNKLYS